MKKINQNAETLDNENSASEAAAEKIPEVQQDYDLGAPLGIVKMTPSEYAAFTKNFLGAPATKEVVKSDKEAKKAANEAVASVNAAERQAKVDATLVVAKEIGLDALPKGVKQAYVMHKTGNSEVGVNVTINGMSGYFGVYVPKGKNAGAGDSWKTSPEHTAKCDQAKRDILRAFSILDAAMSTPE